MIHAQYAYMSNTSTPQLPTAVMPYNVLVGKILQRHRETSGISQSEVAAAAGLTQSAYSRIESGQTALTISHLHVIANALGKKPDEIMREVEDVSERLVSQHVSVPFEKPENNDNAKAALFLGLGVLLVILAAASK